MTSLWLRDYPARVFFKHKSKILRVAFSNFSGRGCFLVVSALELFQFVSLNVAFTAQDRKKALSLKSHVRVISSHEPDRVSQLPGDKRSSYDSSKSQTPGRQSSLESSGTTGIESSLLTDNFKELLLDPVDVQLLKLLGPDAEDFLHPTFRDGAKKTLNPMVVQRKCKYACARACAWGACVPADRARELTWTPGLCSAENNESFGDLVIRTTFSCKLTHSKENDKRCGAQGQSCCK